MRILCADNSPMTRIGISETLSKFGYEITFEADSFSILLDRVQSHSVDLLICELRFEDAELLDGINDLRQRAPELPILIYSNHSNPTFIARAASHRLYDYVLKCGSTSSFIQSVAAAPTGIPPSTSLLLRARDFLTTPMKNGFSAASSLTKRECQILAHLALGLSNREISSSLEISVETAKEHVQNILRKLKSADRTHAAVWAIRNGIPSFDDNN